MYSPIKTYFCPVFEEKTKFNDGITEIIGTKLLKVRTQRLLQEFCGMRHWVGRMQQGILLKFRIRGFRVHCETKFKMIITCPSTKMKKLVECLNLIKGLL